MPSPLYINGYIFMVKNGGIVNGLDAKTGRPAKQGRVSGNAQYYSSPVAGDGKILVFSTLAEIDL